MSEEITLYIKTHNKTGLKYFGKTKQEDVEKYKGSGKYWLRHLKIHGNDVKTEIFGIYKCENCFEKLILEGEALFFSEFYNIVNSNEWANLKLENGLDGGDTSMCESYISKKYLFSHKKENNPFFNKKHSNETKEKMSEAKKDFKPWNTGKVMSKEHCLKLKVPHLKAKGIKKQTELCKYCYKEMPVHLINRWHNENCKEKH